ncbi:hypothetical protein [Paramagnetospirillum marisnigri]|uniref:hypothetical protein n=1 Tax=Paramagnetospirillum marisnigri TaxID=1285242 RepID=UPI0012E8A8DB|nr:hypothetical protein [Paramagnetospirillum marisnigri]
MSASSGGTTTASSTGSATSDDTLFYSSPIFTVDTLTGALVQVWRDSKTGETLSQSPSKAALLYGDAQGRGGAGGGNSRGGGVSILA